MDTKRIFLTCQIPEEVKIEIEKICQHFKDSKFALRYTPKGKLHITLAFLPRVEAGKLAEISIVTKKACVSFSHFSLFLNSLGAFPNLKLPKVVFVSLAGDTGTLGNLARKIQQGLAGLGFSFGEEKFSPHITIARTKSYVNKIERRKLGESIQRWGKLTPVKILVDSISIFESTPTSAGHIHTLLEKIRLG